MKTKNEIRNPRLILKNGILLITRMLFVLFISFYSARLTLDILGVQDFGINSVVGGLISTFAMVSMPLTSSLQRFYNVEFTKQQIPPRVVFSTSLFIIAVLALIMLALYETIGVYAVNYLLNYPEERTIAVNVVFQIAAFTSLAHLLTLPYRGLVYSKEEMGIPAIVEIVTSILKLVFLMVIPSLSYDNLILYFLLLSILKIGELVYYVGYCKFYHEESIWTKERNSGFRDSFLKYSGWNLIGTISGITLTYISNLLINVFGGLIYNTAYGISKQVSSAVISFTSNVLKAIDPQITKSTSVDLDNYRDQLVVSAIKLTLCATGLLTIIFYFEGDLLLKIWLKNVPKYVYEFCVLALIEILFASVTTPLRSVVYATGKIKTFFIFRGLSTSVIMIMMYVMLLNRYPVIIVMYLKMLASLAMFVYAFFNVTHLTSLRLNLLSLSLFKCFLSFIFFTLIYKLLYLLCNNCGFLNFTIHTVISVIAYLPCFYFLVLGQHERNLVSKVYKHD